MDSSEENKVLKAWSDGTQELDAAIQHIVSFLHLCCDDLKSKMPDFEVRLTEKRVKTARGVIRTLDEQNLGAEHLWSHVDDLLGVRIVVATKTMAHRLKDHILQMQPSPFQYTSTKGDFSDPPTGYRAIHLKGRIARSQEYGVEIQIRTALEDAWAVVSRSELYRGQSVPPLLHRTALSASSHLKVVDDDFDMILDEIRRPVVPDAPQAQETGADESLVTAAAVSTEETAEGSRPYPPHGPLTEQDERILHLPISQTRVEQFRESFIEDRTRTATTEMLFSLAGSFELRPPDSAKVPLSTGFNTLYPKGPFVEGSNWMLGSTWGYAGGMEVHLMHRLEQQLLASSQGDEGAEVPREAASIVKAVVDMITNMRIQIGKPSLVLMTGPLSTTIRLALNRLIVPVWQTPNLFRSTFGLLGLLDGVPILHFSEGTTARLFVADLNGLAFLTRYGRLHDFDIQVFTDERAKELLARQPSLIKDPPPGGDEAERVRRLQLMVGVKIFETYEIVPRPALPDGPSLVFGRPLAAPGPE